MLTLSKSKKMVCRIKSQPEDFIVEEISENGAALELGRSYTPDELGFDIAEEGKFTIFVMQKRDWNTTQALKAVARRLRKGAKSTSFAGAKDRISVSTQLCSIFGATPDELLQVHQKDISINCAWRGAEKIKLGQLLGNRFTITAREIEGYDELDRIAGELEGIFPNYFGEQRFGVRDNNVEIGLCMLKCDFKGAVMNFLTDTKNERNEDAVQARSRLSEEQDFKAALQYFPPYLKYELLMIEYLSKFPENYANALRRLPRTLSLMFIHSVEAYIFNKELEGRIERGETRPKEGETVCYPDEHGFYDLSKVGKHSTGSGEKEYIVGTVLGRDTERINEFESDMLDGMGITADSFKVKGMNELNSKGSLRVLFAPYRNFSYSLDEESRSATFKFSLPAGAYATILLDEFARDAGS